MAGVEKVRLLIISNNPQVGSFHDRIGNYLEAMAAHGITPTIEVPSASPLQRIRQYARMDRYDLVLLHKKCLSWFDATFFKPRKARVIFNYDDAIMFNYRGIATHTRVRRFRRSLRRADAVLVGSLYLARLAAPYHTPVHILPLGLNTKKYCGREARKPDGKVRLVWVGRPGTLRYLEPLRPVLQELAGQYPHLVLRLVGEEFIDIPGVTVEKIPWTPEVRYRAMAEGDIGLAPVPDNLFTRGKCTFKILEYSASELPVVASPVGTSVDHILNGITGYLATTPEQWTESLRRLLDDPALRQEMGRRGREHARNFDSSLIGEKFCDMIRQAAAGSSSGRGPN